MNLITAFRWIKTFFIELNLFESIESRANAHHLRSTIIATRIYIILMTIAIFILVLFTALNQNTVLITINNPSEDVFHTLYAKYSSTLQCPCNQVEISYKNFINISYTFHPVCSSVFVSNDWINLLFRFDMGYFFPFDFRSSANGQFQLLASLCSFANRTIKDAINDSLSDSLLSPQVLSSISLTTQSETISDFVKTSTTFTFGRLLSLVRGTTQMNSLQPAMQTARMHLINVYPDDTVDASALETIWPDLNDPDIECFCGVTSNCYAPASFFDLFAEETEGYFGLPVDPTDIVPGFLVGCYALDGLLHSTLQCFYDSTCLAMILTYFPSNNITDLVPIDINQTKYSSEITIEAIANDLFLEQWLPNTSFSAYYSTCAPRLCTYRITQYNSILQIITTLLGVYGGLTVILQTFVLHTVLFWRNYRLQRQTRLNDNITFVERVRNVPRFIKGQFHELNLFKRERQRNDAYEQRTGIISTRIYLLSLLIALSIIIIYLLSALRVHTITVEKPSQMTFENLYQKYATSLQCPCSRIANSYGLFTSLSPVFHPVCTSLYISDTWIVSISGLNYENSVFDDTDFRTAGQTFFTALATLCSLSNTTIVDSWYTFGQTSLITDFTLIESEFQARTKVAIEQFEKSTISEFKRILSLIQLHTITMYAMGFTHFFLYTNQLSTSTTPFDFNISLTEPWTCPCDLEDQCTDVISFFNYTDNTIYNPYNLKFTLSDIKVGCYVVSSTLQSSIDCFFNQTCLNIVQHEVVNSRSINISILNPNSTRFGPDSLLGVIVDNLMVETWNEEMNYEQYFQQCAPEQCTYTYTASQNLLYIITTIFGLFGGLSVALKIAVPLIVRWIRSLIRKRRQRNALPVRTAGNRRIRTLLNTVRIKLLQFNMFKTDLSWDDEQRSRREIRTTRLYLLLLITSVIILVIYTFIDTQTKLVTVINPSQQQFDQLRLHSRSSGTLDCPCQNIIISYQSFISIKPHYHQFCSSDFIATNSSWLSLLYSWTATSDYSYDDYRIFAVPQFRSLSSLCTLANDTVTESISEFLRNVLITERVQSRETIELQANSTLNQFRLSTPRTFVRTLDFIRSMAQGNGIVSSVLSNWHFLSGDEIFEWATLWGVPRSYGNDSCSCGTNAMCISQAEFDGYIVPGFQIGCYPLEALLQSTLECLYDISCIDQLKSMYNQTNLTFNALDASLSSPTRTVQSLVDTLLVETWETNVTYDQYYTACTPLSCTYTYNGEISLLYTITTIIGLYGGLSVMLKLIVPALVKIGYRIVSSRHRRVQQTVIVSTVSGAN